VHKLREMDEDVRQEQMKMILEDIELLIKPFSYIAFPLHVRPTKRTSTTAARERITPRIWPASKDMVAPRSRLIWNDASKSHGDEAVISSNQPR
jgi:hypothetical protein